MIGSVKRARALLRHWVLQASKSMSLGWEHLAGWLRAILWVPLLPWIYISRKWERTRDNQGRGFGIERVFQRFLVTRYINLEHRSDRNLETNLELRNAGFENFQRFPAIRHSVGALGCARSHIAVLEALSADEVDAAFVCEDDIEFVCEPHEVARVLDEFLARPELDVLCLSFRLRGPAFPIGSHLALANNLQTTAGYVVKNSALKPLLESFRQSASQLERGVSLQKASIDIRWKSLQWSTLLFCVPRQPIARQRESHSDIVGKVKFYR